MKLRLDVKHEESQVSPEHPESSVSPATDSNDYSSIAGTSTALLNTLASSLEHMDYNENFADSVSISKKMLLNGNADSLELDGGKSSQKTVKSNGSGQRRQKTEQTSQHSFSGRHVMWSHFDVSRQDTGYYYCRASPDCNSAYTWPPSTTVAGRHVRDRHPEVYIKIMSEHSARKFAYDAQFNNQMRSSTVAGTSRKRHINALSIATSVVQNHTPTTSSSAGAGLSSRPSPFVFPATEASATFEIRPTKLVKLEEIINGLNNSNSSGLIDEAQDDYLDRQSSAEAEAEINSKVLELERLRDEMVSLRENERLLTLKNDETSEKLLDVQAEANNLRARNGHLEKRQKQLIIEAKQAKDELTEVSEQKAQLEKEYFKLELSFKDRDLQLQTLKSENAELRKSLNKTRSELDELLDANLVRTDENVMASAAADEGELAAAHKVRRHLEAKLAEMEGELEDALLRNQSLEQKSSRLEATVERLRADLQREADNKETEIAELRAQFQRRARTFEDEIAELGDANASLLKRNRTLESRVRQIDTQSQASSVDLGGSALHFKRELRKALALLRDTQTVLAHERESTSNNTIIRQLREQVEDAENAKLTSLRTRHTLENEISDLRSQLDTANAAKCAADEKVLTIMRDKNSANILVQEHDEQLQDLLKKHKALIQQSHVDSLTLADQTEQIANLERSNQKLQEQLNEAAVNIEFNKFHTVEKHKVQLVQLKLRDLQAKLDLETSQKLRFESIIAKLKEEIESLQEQLLETKSSRDRDSEALWKSKKDQKMLQEEINDLKKRESDLLHRYKSTKATCEQLTDQHEKTQSELRLALKRVDALQATLNTDLTAGSDIEEEDDRDDEDEQDIRDDDFVDDGELLNGGGAAVGRPTVYYTDDEGGHGQCSEAQQ